VEAKKKFDCERQCHLSLDPHLGLDDGGSGIDINLFIIKINYGVIN